MTTVEGDWMEPEVDREMNAHVASYSDDSSVADNDYLGMISHCIDFAERCLVSSMYQEAVASATSSLRALVKMASDERPQLFAAESMLSVTVYQVEEGDSCAEIASMVEASGIVLMQALHELGRTSNIFDELVSIFGSITKLPYTLILTGVCLQLSISLHAPAKAILEEYLNGWRSLEKNSDAVLTKPVKHIGILSENHSQHESFERELSDVGTESSWSYLARRDYIQLTEIYVIEVLAKVQKNPDASLQWIKQADISSGERQVIAEKIHGAIKRYPSNIRDSRDLMKTATGITDDPSKPPVQPKQNTEYNDECDPPTMDQTSEATKEEQNKENASHSKSRAISRGTICGRFPFMRTLCTLVELVMMRFRLVTRSNWTSVHENLPKGSVILAGAFSSILVYALLRKRHILTRILKNLFISMKVGFGDLWQLAFSVQLNPLAAVQPIPSTRALVA